MFLHRDIAFRTNNLAALGLPSCDYSSKMHFMQNIAKLSKLIAGHRGLDTYLTVGRTGEGKGLPGPASFRFSADIEPGLTETHICYERRLLHFKKNPNLKT